MSGSNQVSAGSIEKSRKSDHASGRGDYISSLPNCVIIRILSLLPIKDVVQTSVLSENWKENWMAIYNLDIDVVEFFRKSSEDNAEIFATFVNKMLAHKHNLRGFRINFYGCGEHVPSDFPSWIFAALRRKVEILEIIMSFNDFDSCDYDERILHCSLQNCGSVRILVVIMPFTFRIIDHDCFSKLVRLELDSVTLLTEYWSEIDNDCIIKIVGSSLEKFITAVGPPENIVFDGSTVVHAYMCCSKSDPHEFEECGLQIRKLLRELPHVKDMVLLGFLEAIAHTKQGLTLKKLTDLEELHVTSPIDVEGILELLHATPNLKFLEICMGNVYQGRDVVEVQDDYDYDAVEDKPSCLASHLKKVKLDYSSRVEPNFELAKFFLKNGSQLKTFEVCGSPDFPTSKILDELLTFPKSSTCLTIKGSTCSNFFYVW